MSLSFIRGLVAAVNPCGFILLPTYLMYFLGISASGTGTQRATIRRALLVSAAVSSGFLTVFLIAGAVAHFSTSWITENSKYATGFFGVALIGLGIAMLFGYKPPFMTPSVKTGEKDKTVRSMFVYGIAYAVASIGCTIGLFIATVFSTSSRDGVVAGVGNVVAYGAGMALLVSGLTVALAFANTGLLKFLRKSLQYVDRVAAFFVALSGVYLLWYFYWVDVENPWRVTAFGNRTLEVTLADRTRARSTTDPITEWVEGLQGDANVFLDANWPIVAIVFLSIVGAAIAYVMSKKWRDVAVVAGLGALIAIGVNLSAGTELWRIGIVTAFAALGATLGVRSAERQATLPADLDTGNDSDTDVGADSETATDADTAAVLA